MVVLAIAVPATILLVRQAPATQSTASQSAIIAFSPTQKQAIVGEVFPLDIWLNPGSSTTTDTIASLTLDITYDPTLVQIADFTKCLSLTSNLNTISGEIECGDGNIMVKLSASNINMLVKSSTKVAAIQLRALSQGTTDVSFGAKTAAGSVTNVDGNVLGSQQPAVITILP